MPVKYVDNADSVLASSVHPGDTTIVVKDDSEFPVIASGEWFYITIGAEEVVKVIGRVGSLFSLDNSVQNGYPEDTIVNLRMCSALLRDLGHEFFFENNILMEHGHSITPGKNAMSAGPITLAPGVEITIPDGSTYTIV